MGLPKRLTEMQMRFAEYYVYGDENGPMTKTEAAIKADTVQRELDRKDQNLQTQNYLHS